MRETASPRHLCRKNQMSPQVGVITPPEGPQKSINLLVIDCALSVLRRAGARPVRPCKNGALRVAAIDARQFTGVEVVWVGSASSMIIS